MIANFVDWSERNHLRLNITKTKELVIDFRKNKEPLTPVTIHGKEVEIVQSYKYLGVHIDNKLDWSINSDAIYKKGLGRLFFLRKLRSFNVCNRLLLSFYQSVMASVIFYAVVCWGGNISKGDAAKVTKLIKKAGSVIGIQLDPLDVILEKRVRAKTSAILGDTTHPLYEVLSQQQSTFSQRMLSIKCSTERFRLSFFPAAIRYYNE